MTHFKLVLFSFLVLGLTAVGAEIPCEGTLKYKGGKTLRDGYGRFYYPNGKYIVDGYNRLYYANGKYLRDGYNRFYYANGKYILDGYDRLYYPNGKYIIDGYSRVYYSSGKYIQDGYDRFYHPNGKYARDGYGRLYRADGSQTQFAQNLVENTHPEVIVRALVDKQSAEITIGFPSCEVGDNVSLSMGYHDKKFSPVFKINTGYPGEYVILKQNGDKISCVMAAGMPDSFTIREKAATVDVKVHSGYSAREVHAAIRTALQGLGK